MVFDDSIFKRLEAYDRHASSRVEHARKFGEKPFQVLKLLVRVDAERLECPGCRINAACPALAAAALAMLGAELLFASGLLRRETARAARRLWPIGATALFAGAICSTSAADLNRRGNEHYASAEYADAVARYQEARSRAPDEPGLPYNAGNAYNRRGEFDTAVQESSRALADGSGIEAQAEYAIGNHHAGAGRLAEAREAYKRALLADPDDADAKHNLEVIDARSRATPTPEPTPSPVPADDPGNDGDPSDGDPGDGEPGDGTPAAGEGTPAAGDPGDMSPEELERLLAEALAGIDSEFTVEEALRALDLLAERNRTTAQEGAATGVGSAGPDW
jgi:tetratricopeptide (TPR) repeat protein